MVKHTNNEKIEAAFDVPFNYSVLFTRNVFDASNTVLTDLGKQTDNTLPNSALVFVDDGVANAWPELIPRIQQYFSSNNRYWQLPAEPQQLPGGEAGKNSFDIPLKVIRLARRVHLDRHSFIIAVGGGAFLDSVGFAASMIHRGVRLIRLPTTVLAQNDSGIGVKNGVNLQGAKNFLGTFAPPYAVINDNAFIATLSDRDWRAGITEAFKVATIKDKEFLYWLQKNTGKLRERNDEAMQYLIKRCAELHVEHIQSNGDPFEFGDARPLDFGHWLGHKLESLTFHELNHGEAVSIGICVDLLYAAQLGYIPKEEAISIIVSLSECGLPIWHDTCQQETPDNEKLIYHGIEEFREHLGGKLCITLPKPVGDKTEINTIDTSILEKCINELQEYETAYSFDYDRKYDREYDL